MRLVRYNVAASLDGYVAGPHGGFDWIPDDPTVDFAGVFATVDTVLLGRKSYEVALDMGAPAWTPDTRVFVSPARCVLRTTLPSRSSLTTPSSAYEHSGRSPETAISGSSAGASCSARCSSGARSIGSRSPSRPYCWVAERPCSRRERRRPGSRSSTPIGTPAAWSAS